MIKSSTSNSSIRMNRNMKTSAEELYEETSPNRGTLSALLEAERIAKDSSIKGYRDVEELFADLDA